MKKVALLFLIMALMLNLMACGTSNTGQEASSQEASSQEVPSQAAAKGKVAIVTSTVSMTEEEYRSAEEMAKKYGDRVVHVTWPENVAQEQEQMITVLTRLASDPDIKVVVLNQATLGTNAAVDKLREMRDDILLIYCNFSENPPDVAARADVAILGDAMAQGPVIAQQAHKMGAETLIHYSFPRHLALSIFSVQRDSMKEECEKLGIEFVDVTAPDPTGDAGVSGTQQFILEDIPKKVDQYGPNTAFRATNCAMQIPMIQQVAELGAIYVLPCCPSPFHGFPMALGLDVPEDKRGDVDFVVEATRVKLQELGGVGRFSNFPVPGAYMLSVTGIEYGLKYIDGETDGKFDMKVLQEVMEDYAGVKMTYRKMEDAGATYDNVLMYLMDFITY